MKGSESFLNSVNLLHNKHHKIKPSCGVSYKDSPD